MPATSGTAFPGGWNSGILDIYGLRARAMDVSRFMVDISLDDLLSRKFEVPSFTLKEDNDMKTEFKDGLGQQIDAWLPLLPKFSAPGAPQLSKIIDSPYGLANGGAKNVKNANTILDLEHALQQEEEGGVSRMEITKMETESDSAPATNLEIVADRETMASSTAAPTDGIASSRGPSRFSIDRLPVESVETFLSRLKLISGEPLQSLISQPWADGESSVALDSRTSREVIDFCHRTGSVPPLYFSHPPLGPLNAETSRYNPRVWVRTSTAENSGGDGGTGSSGKEASNGAEEDASASRSSKQNKLDDKDKIVFPINCSSSGTPFLSAGQAVPSSTLSLEATIPSVKEEPRHLENAAGLSSEVHGNPMEIDSCRVENGSLSASGADGTSTTQVDCERESGNAVRPLETPASLAAPEDMDTSPDGAGEPITISPENVDQTVKDQGESSGGAGSEPQPSGLPPLDLKINIRMSSPPQNELPSSSSAQPSSPQAEAAARLLVSMANSTYFPELEKTELEGERRRRIFQPYPGAPAQKSTKSMRVSSSATAPAEGGREWKRNGEGVSVPASKALGSERRKSLSQVNDVSEKPMHSSPRSFGAGVISTSSRGGNHTGSRSSNLSMKSEKVSAREPSKDLTSIKEIVGRGNASSLPPLSNGGPPIKNVHKTLKTNNYVHSSDSKGSVVTTSFAKVPAASTTQRVGTGGTSSRSSRTNHSNNSVPAQHSPAPQSYKSSRQSIPDNRQKIKTDGSGRGSKPS